MARPSLSSSVRLDECCQSWSTTNLIEDAHDLTDSTISGLNVLNTPVQGFSVDGAQNLKIEDVTIDDSAGDTGK